MLYRKNSARGAGTREIIQSWHGKSFFLRAAYLAQSYIYMASSRTSYFVIISAISSGEISTPVEMTAKWPPNPPGGLGLKSEKANFRHYLAELLELLLSPQLINNQFGPVAHSSPTWYSFLTSIVKTIEGVFR